jgi:primosomal protein N' (replication factor Y)
VEGPLVACGPGIERIAEEVTDRFPDASVEILSSDRRLGPAALQEIFNDMALGRVDILIGTQMVAKGHHFPGLTLVGVVDGDLGLEGGDPRASERTFQLLSQVAGRAGRAAKKGRVLIQTRAPEHPVMTCLAEGDRDAFISNELVARERAILPPFGKLASLIISGRDRGQVDELSRELARLAPNIQGVAVLGPVEAPISLLRGRFRNRLLVKAKRTLNMQAYLTQWIASVKPPNSVRITIDVDPYSFF